MSVPATSPRRATYDAVALALAFIAVDALVIMAVLSEWLERSTGVVAVLALAAIVLLLYRDDVAEAIATGNQMIGLAVDDTAALRALDALRGEGWTVDHDVANAKGTLIGTLVQGPSGAYIVQVRNRAYRLEHLRRARRDAAGLHGGVGGWVTPILVLALRDDDPHRRNGVWIMGAEHLAGWLRRRTPPRGVDSPDSRK
jgi:hypothetical protein